jgi:hypothetical protein
MCSNRWCKLRVVAQPPAHVVFLLAIIMKSHLTYAFHSKSAFVVNHHPITSGPSPISYSHSLILYSVISVKRSSFLLQVQRLAGSSWLIRLMRLIFSWVYLGPVNRPIRLDLRRRRLRLLLLSYFVLVCSVVLFFIFLFSFFKILIVWVWVCLLHHLFINPLWC